MIMERFDDKQHCKWTMWDLQGDLRRKVREEDWGILSKLINGGRRILHSSRLPVLVLANWAIGSFDFDAIIPANSRAGQ